MLNALIVAGAVAGLVALILVVEERIHRFGERWPTSVRRPFSRGPYPADRFDPPPDMFTPPQLIRAFFRRDPTKFTVLLD